MADKAKAQNEIDFLAKLERGEVVTQMSLAKHISVSVGLINALLKRATKKGYVKAKAAPYKRYAYYLTPKGFREKSRLVAEYLETSLEFFRVARDGYGTLFEREKKRGKQYFILAGYGELVEIALLAARENGINVIGVYDRESNLEQKHGLSILQSQSDLLQVDGVVIVESRHPQDMFDHLRSSLNPDQILAPAFLRITREKIDFRAPDVAQKGIKK